MAEINAFDQLVLEHERTLFMFYGFRNDDGTQGAPYFKLARSLSEALGDLMDNPTVADEGGFFVRDAFLEKGENEGESPTIHVELTSVQEILCGLEEDES